MSGLYSCPSKVIRAGQELAGSTPSTVQRSLSFHGQGTATLYCSRTFVLSAIGCNLAKMDTQASMSLQVCSAR